MIKYKDFTIRQSLLSHYFRVYSPFDYLYPNTFDSVKQAKQFIDIIKGEKNGQN